MITQRVMHGMHTAAEVSLLFDEELAKLCAADPTEAERYRDARAQSEAMIVNGFHDPI
jgi:acetyl/propionyl-CoA carboxylase alpha subunit